MAWLPKGSSTARGYGSDWQRVRRSVLAAEPLCRTCAAQGRVTAATDVDHIEPFSGIADPKRLDPTNLRPLCQPCHMTRTARQASGKTDAIGCDAEGWPLDPVHPWRSVAPTQHNLRARGGGSSTSGGNAG